MNFLIITLVLLVSQSIASDETEKNADSREAVEDTQKEPEQLLRDTIDDSELVKADKSHESRFDRASGSDDDVDEKAAEGVLEAKSSLDRDVSRTVESRSADNIKKSADSTDAFVRDGVNLEQTEEVSLTRSAEDDADLEKIPKPDESEKSAEEARESEKRTIQHDEIRKDGAEVSTIPKSRRMLGDDFLDLKARSGNLEEHRNDNLKSFLLDGVKSAQNLNPLDSHSTYSQLNPVVKKQVFRSFYTVQPTQLIKFSSHETPLTTFQTLLPTKRTFDVSRESGNQFRRVNIFTSNEHIRNAYPFQTIMATTQKTLPNQQIPIFTSRVNDILSKYAKPTETLSNFNTDFSQRLHNQPFMPLPLLHPRFPRFIPIPNILGPFLN